MRLNFKYLKSVWLFAILFVLFFSYRLYFWDASAKHINHVVLNSLGDALLSGILGLLIFKYESSSQKRKIWFYLKSIFTTSIFVLGIYRFHYFIYSHYGVLKGDFVPFFTSICFQIFDSLAIMVTGAFAILIDCMNREKGEINLRYMALNNEKLNTELKFLKAQLDPHFIFNSLNTIYYQIHDENKEAKESITHFSDILRYHIESSGLSSISIHDELKYILAYIEFQSKRSGDYLEVSHDISLNSQEFNIEPLLLMPLVENAFKHVNYQKEKKGIISIQAIWNGREFEFNIKNTIDLNKNKTLTGFGIGLQNVLKRLELIYKNRHSFELNTTANEGYCYCTLKLWN